MKKLAKSSLSVDFEMPILRFLWRWKVATTSAIYLRFQPDFKWATFTAYSRMRRLRRKGFVDLKYSDTCTFKVWSLTQKGFKAIYNSLSPLREEGYLSENIEHDIYVLAAHNGDWLPRRSAEGVRTITEQELRRFANERLPNLIPDTNDHRPDGYWIFGENTQRKLVALEVELTRKSSEDYLSIGEFYNSNPNITSVIWIVQSQSLANKIVLEASKNLGAYRDIHNFVLLEDLIKNGWSAKIFFGKYRLIKMSDFLKSHRENQAGTTAEPEQKHGSGLSILDGRNRRFNSSGYKNIRKSEFGN